MGYMPACINYKCWVNKGEWSEFYAFIRLLVDKYLSFGNKDGNSIDEYVVILKLKHNNTDIEYFKNNGQIEIKDIHGTTIRTYTVPELIERINIEEIYQKLKTSKGSSFLLPKAQEYFEILNIDSFKGSSYSKGDLNVSFNSDGIQYLFQDISIKSDIGKKPTLLNSSSATNFIFKINNLNTDIDSINNIKTKYKIRDRISHIYKLNSSLEFIKCEQEIHSNNLKKVDSLDARNISGHFNQIL